jgi:hypothetical protein
VNFESPLPPARRLIALLLAGSCLGIAACQPNDRAWSTGSVTFEGRQVEHGMIVFRPLDGGNAPAGAAIAEGRFAIAGRPGRHRVEIRGTRPVDASQQPRTMPRIEGAPIYEDFIPPAYNTESTLEVDVAAGSSNEFDFDLQPLPTGR